MSAPSTITPRDMIEAASHALKALSGERWGYVVLMVDPDDDRLKVGVASNLDPATAQSLVAGVAESMPGVPFIRMPDHRQ